MRKTVTAVTIVMLVLPSLAYPEEVRIENSYGVTNRLSADLGPLAKAGIREATRLELVVAREAQGSQQAQRRNWLARHPALTGLLVGAAVGAPVFYAGFKDVGCGDSGTPPCPGVYATIGAGVFGGIGAGIGALIGLAFRKRRRFDFVDRQE